MRLLIKLNISATAFTQPEYKTGKWNLWFKIWIQFPHYFGIYDEESPYVTQWNSGKVYPQNFKILIKDYNN